MNPTVPTRQMLQEAADYKSSEFLVRTAKALLPESEDPLDINSSVDMSYISTLLNLGRSNEALHFAEAGAEISRLTLGESHPTRLEYLAKLGLAYLDQEKFEETIDILQTVLRLQKLDETQPEVIERIDGLGKAFRGVSRHQEALIYLETTFRGMVSNLGALNNKTKEACWNLGDSYTQLQNYPKTSNLYSLYIEEIRGVTSEYHPFISEVKGWLNHVNFQMTLVC